ncbi:MAG: helix-turn-helix domain-containing protein [Nocardioides sp.]|uniref:IclR family transcriptional regulator n=1 Tax=Nocardioides sp. TaxID=35761 RepID=UPI0023A044B7|nr:helix-turn-helix domain-containing protein [Nocardioides sp.]MDE0775439.1 helix-turn-helix domain-containing protein [Nocardioides sp.]
MAEGDGSQTLERGLAVMVELGRHPAGLTTAEVAVECGLHRSITHRLLVSLVRTGFAARSQDRYVVGPTARSVVGIAPSLRAVAAPVLESLAREIDATASLVEVSGGFAVATIVAEPPTDGPRFSYRLGNRDPLDRGAGGLAALASHPPSMDPPRVAEVRTQGYVTTYAKLNPGAYGIAAPLPGWPVPAAINIVTGHQRLTQEAIEPLLRAVSQIGTQHRDGPEARQNTED